MSSSSNNQLPSVPDMSASSFGRSGADGTNDNQTGEFEAEPVRRRRSGKARSKIVVLFNLLFSGSVLAVIAVGMVIYIANQSFNAKGPLRSETIVFIKKGSGLDQIATALETGGVIDQPFLFKMGVRAYKAQRLLKAGEYAFNPAMSMRQVMRTLTSGKAILHVFTAPEGLTTIQIMRRLAANEILTGNLPETPAEGALLPETYSFQRGETRETIVKKMLDAQTKMLAKIWANRDPDLPISTPQELVTLASIVEKETGIGSERPLVASVFVNRLNKGMKLQSDPTIIYGIFGGQGNPKGRPIYRSDIAKPTAYNTYTIPALPPGPIASPGRAAMEAVARPDKSDYLFFVADGSGGHAFARTLKEHEANVARWRQIEKVAKAKAKAAAEGGETGESKTSE